MYKLTKWQHNPIHYLGTDLEKSGLEAARVLLAGSRAGGRLRKVLRDDGYAVITCPMAYEMLRYVKTRERTYCDPADVIVVDLSRDVRRGLRLIEAVRMIDWAIPVVAFCSPKHNTVIEELTRLGVTTFPPSADIDDVRTAIVAAVPPFSTLSKSSAKPELQSQAQRG